MLKHMENLKIEDIHRGFSKISSSVTNRKSSSFILRVSGSVRYTFADKSIDVLPGEITYLPKGSSYSFCSLTGEPCEYVAVRFSAENYKAHPLSYSLDAFSDADEFAESMVELWKFGSPADRYKCYSVFYSLLAYIENLEDIAYEDKKKINVILPALTYLRMHIYDCDLKIETLYRLCGISHTYFSKIFVSRYGKSPQKYILKKRLSHAKSIFETGSFDSISEVANSVGYDDPLYFSRIFKKVYGVSPSEYIKG